MCVAVCLKRRTAERKDSVLTDKEAGEILEKLSSSLPLPSDSSQLKYSLLTH